LIAPYSVFNYYEVFYQILVFYYNDLINFIVFLLTSLDQCKNHRLSLVYVYGMINLHLC